MRYYKLHQNNGRLQSQTYMKSLILITLLLASTLGFQLSRVSEVNWPFKSCGEGAFSVSKFTWSQTPAKGKTVTLSVTGTAKSDIAFDQANISLSINGLPINVIVDSFKKTYSKGSSITYTYKYELPSSSGSYGNIVAFYNAKEDTLACVQVSYKF